MRLALAALATCLVAAPAAHACGGFFCSNQPMDQAGERIAFALADGKVQAHVQIQYAGAADKFSWVVPLHGRPEISIGSSQLFRYLEQTTAPRFQAQYEGQCFQVLAESDNDGNSPTAGGGGGGGVQVVSREQVGPYDAAILTATDATALTEWLATNGYELGDGGAAALGAYVGQGYYFVALKLQQDKGTGDLRPVVLTFDSEVPCIPIRLTAIAARPDMPIVAWVLSDRRAVPVNYRHVLINESRIDWLSGGSNYVQVASAAVDEAGGRAFLTEYAGSTAAVFGSNKLDDGRLDTTPLAALTDPVAFFEEVIRQQYPRDGLLELARRYIPMPESLVNQGVSEQQFYNRMEDYREAIASDPDRIAFDPAAFAHELETTIVAPLREAQKMLDAHTYVTRLFTTMSANEMTVDPEFLFNSDLGDVSNVHTAKVTCDGERWDDPMTVTLADGRQFVVTQRGGPLADGPAAARIEQLAAMGPPSIVEDNDGDIDDAIKRSNGCSGCTTWPGAALSLAALALVRRRRS